MSTPMLNSKNKSYFKVIGLCTPPIHIGSTALFQVHFQHRNCNSMLARFRLLCEIVRKMPPMENVNHECLQRHFVRIGLAHTNAVIRI